MRVLAQQGWSFSPALLNTIGDSRVFIVGSYGDFVEAGPEAAKLLIEWNFLHYRSTGTLLGLEKPDAKLFRG